VILALLSLAVSINLNGRSSSPVSAAVACPVPKLQEKGLEEFLFVCELQLHINICLMSMQ
jgi:hypothetical protein